MLDRSIYNNYVNEYLKLAEKAGMLKENPAIILLNKIYEVANREEYLPGNLLYAGIDQETRKRFFKYGMKAKSGLGVATWCTFVAYYILYEMNYNVFPILDKVKHDIAYTTAREMYENAKGDLLNCAEISWKTAVIQANKGIPILIAALGRGKNQCHVGIVAPQFTNIDKAKMTDVIVGQGGYYNGFGTIADFFNRAYVGEPAFFELKKRG